MPEPKLRHIPKPIWFGVAAVLMMVLAVFLSVWLPYHREQVVIREIERLGGEVVIFWDGPKWIKKLVEIELSWFDRVWFVDLSKTTVSDEGLQHISSLINLDTLGLGNTRVSDKGLKHLSGLKNLSWLHLDHTQISDDGLKHLSGLMNLEKLSLGNIQVSDKGLKHLSGLTNLDDLRLDNTQVSKEGIKELQKALPNCVISY